MVEPVVVEALKWEFLEAGGAATRRLHVRWSDGSEGVALEWYGDEILICEGDVLGRTSTQLRALKFRRDRDYLQESRPADPSDGGAGSDGPGADG